MSKTKYRIKKNDVVIVTAGADKGKVARVLKVAPKPEHLIVEGVRIVKRHQKPVGDNPGGIVLKEAPIHISNVALWNSEEKRRVKIGFTTSDGKKIRVDRKTGQAIADA